MYTTIPFKLNIPATETTFTITNDNTWRQRNTVHYNVAMKGKVYGTRECQRWRSSTTEHANVSDEGQVLRNTRMSAMKVKYYGTRECQRWRSSTTEHANVSDECQVLSITRMSAMNVKYYRSRIMSICKPKFSMTLLTELMWLLNDCSSFYYLFIVRSHWILLCHVSVLWYQL